MGKGARSPRRPTSSIFEHWDDPLKLLTLRHYRTKHTPEERVSFDNHQLRGSWLTGCVHLEFQEGCVVLYGKDYGNARHCSVPSMKYCKFHKRSANSWSSARTIQSFEGSCQGITRQCKWEWICSKVEWIGGRRFQYSSNEQILVGYQASHLSSISTDSEKLH